MAWLALLGAILTEVSGTLALRMAATGARRWYALVLTGYPASFALLSVALSRGVQLGVAYGIWSALGVALVTAAGRVLFHEPIGRAKAVGVLLIIAGVAATEIGAA